MRTANASRGNVCSAGGDPTNARERANNKTTASELQAPGGTSDGGKPPFFMFGPADDDDEPLMTTKEVARWLRLDPRTVRELGQMWHDSEGREGLRGSKVAKKCWRFRRCDVEDYIRRSARY
jgi:hypothetical protein